MPIKYFAFDTETTGLDPNTGDEIISLAYMLLDENFVCAKKEQWFVNPSPGTVVSPEAARINGYTPELWASRNAIEQDDLIVKLISLWSTHGVRRAYPLGQNVGFDVNFLEALGRRNAAFAAAQKQALAYHKVDTLSIAVSLDVAHAVSDMRYNLTALAERWEVPLTNAHDSLADLEATVEVFLKLVKHLKTAHTPPLAPPPSFIEKTGTDHTFRFGKHKGLVVDTVDPGYLRWVLDNVKLRDSERATLSTALAQALR